jgi:hypothetical protein
LRIRHTTAEAYGARPPRRPPGPACLWLAATLALNACSIFHDDGVPRSRRPSNQWQLVFSETAQSEGSIDFLVSPVGGAPITVSVPVALNQTDADIAAAAARSFAATLGDRYEVDKDWGAEIHVAKADRKQPDFSLTLVRLSAQGVRVDLDRE